MRKTNMKIFYALFLIHYSKVYSSEAPLTTVASEQVSNMKELIKFMREEAAFEKRDIEEGVLHIGIADVKQTLLAKVEELRATKPDCVKDTEAVANGIVSEIGNYVKQCFAQIEGKLDSVSKMADNAKITSEVDELVTTVSNYYNNRKSHLDKCTKPAAKRMIALMQREERRIENCVKGATPTVTMPEVTKPEVTRPEENKPVATDDTKPKPPSSNVIYYIIHPPIPFTGCTCKPRRPRRPRPRRPYRQDIFFWN